MKEQIIKRLRQPTTWLGVISIVIGAVSTHTFGGTELVQLCTALGLISADA